MKKKHITWAITILLCIGMAVFAESLLDWITFAIFVVLILLDIFLIHRMKNLIEEQRKYIHALESQLDSSMHRDVTKGLINAFKAVGMEAREITTEDVILDKIRVAEEQEDYERANRLKIQLENLRKK